MSVPKIKMEGKRFGRLVVVGFHSVGHSRLARYICLCDCGKYKVICGGSLRRGKTVSCGCKKYEPKPELSIRNTTHGMTGTSTYSSWANMIQRCTNPLNHKYTRYGGRGITVCPQWRTFNGFLEDMGEAPPGMTIGRIDNDGNYCRENCRWETIEQQANNRSNNRVIEHNGLKMTTAQWADHLGISFVALRMRLHRGWDLERVLQ